MNPYASVKELQKSLRRQANRANKRIQRLYEKGYTEDDIQPLKNLYRKMEDIGGFTESGTIKYGGYGGETPEETKKNLKNALKAVEQFLDTQTSSLTGIKKWQKNVKAGFKSSFDIDAKTASRMEDLYQRNRSSAIMKKYFYETFKVGYSVQKEGGSFQDFLDQLGPLTDLDVSIDGEYRDDLIDIFREM